MSPDFEIMNYRRFRPCVVSSAKVELLCEGLRWGEGPVFFADYDMIVWSDLANDRIMRWTEGGTSVFRSPSNFTNGNARDKQGRLVSCETGARRITRTEYNGDITVLADSYDGKRLNSPNDVIVTSDDAIWFTDPDYGIMADYVGARGVPEQAGNFVFRLDPHTGALRIATDAMVRPNGLAMSPDEKTLYVADSGRSHDPQGPHHILAFDVKEGKLGEPRVFATIDPGVPDGFCVDEDGSIWTSAGDGVHCIAADGELIGKIIFPEVVTNVTFGGRSNSRLIVTTASTLQAVYVGRRGAVR